MPATDDLADLSSSQSRRRGPALAALLLGLLWLTIAAAAVAIGIEIQTWVSRINTDQSQVANTIALLTLQIAPPLAIVGLALAALRRSSPDAAALTTALEIRQARVQAAAASLRVELEGADRTLAGVGDRLATLQANAAGDTHGLTSTAERLEAATTAMMAAAQTSTGAAARLQASIEGSRHQAEAVTVLLDTSAAETARQLDSIETMLAAVWSRNADAAVQVDGASVKLQALLASVEGAATRATTAVGDHAAALHGKAEAAFDRTTAALAATRQGVDAQAAALSVSIDQARETLDHIGGEAARVIGKRLDRLNEAAEQLGKRLTEQEARSRGLVDTVERSFTVLDTRLDHAAKSSYGALDGIAERMAIVGNQVQTLNLPLRQTHELTVETEVAMARLHTGAIGVTGALTSALPLHQADVAQLSDSLTQLQAALLRLHEPVEHSRALIGTATGELLSQHTQLEAATGKLTAHFEAARGVLGAVEAQAEGSALAASSQLIEVLGRVREIAAASAGQMRDTLAGVVAEAEAALAHAGTTTAGTAFGEPVRAQLAVIEAVTQQAAQAAQAAVDRVAQRLLGLTSTVALVEARIDEVQTHNDVQARDDLRTRSARLLESLNAASIDVARLLMLDVGDASWNAYLKGDRSIFTRRVVRLADAATARAIKRHYNHDAPFRALAVQFVDEFQRLLKYVDADKDGRALAVTLLSSDIGKLYVVLEQAIGQAK